MEIVASSRTAIALTEFERVAAELEHIETIPVVAQRLLAVTANPEYRTEEVHDLVSSDPGIAASLMRVASTPAYSVRPVSNLRGALIRVGMRDLRKLVMAAAMTGGRRMSAFDRQLWQYSLRCAAVTEAIINASGVDGPDDPFLCGLLHDFGTAVFAKIHGSEYRASIGTPGGDGQCDRERERYGFDHADLGAMVASKWKLFAELEYVMQLHHDPFAVEELDLPTSHYAAVYAVALAREVIVDEPDGERVGRLCDALSMSDADADAARAHGLDRYESIYSSIVNGGR